MSELSDGCREPGVVDVHADGTEVGPFAGVVDEVLKNMRSVLLAEHARLLAARLDQDTLPVSVLPEGPADLTQASDPTAALSVLPQGPADATEAKNPTAAPVTVTVSARAKLKQCVDTAQNERVHHIKGLADDHKLKERAKLQLSQAVHRDKMAIHMVVSWEQIMSLFALCTKFPVLTVDSIMGVVIILNAAAVGISADTNDWGGWFFVDSMFCLLFLIEFLLKLRIEGCRLYWLGPGCMWQWFECVILSASVFDLFVRFWGYNVQTDAAILRMIRLVRLTKLLRMCRFKFVADLVLMVNGAMGGLGTLFWCVLMISLPLYVVALVLRETLGKEEGVGNGAESFSTLSKAFFNIFRCIVAGDCSDGTGRPIFVLVSDTYGCLYGILYASTVVFMTFGLFNVIVAIYVENTVNAAKHNDAKRKEARLQDKVMFTEKTLQIALLAYSYKQGIDINDIALDEAGVRKLYEMELTKAEFARIVDDPNVTELLSDLDVADKEHHHLFHTLDVDGGGTLDIQELVTGIAALRGDARRSDVVANVLMLRRIVNVQAGMNEMMANHSTALQSIAEALQKNSMRANARQEGQVDTTDFC